MIKVGGTTIKKRHCVSAKQQVLTKNLRKKEHFIALLYTTSS